jgi:MFS family permease
VLVAGWLVAIPVPFVLMWAPAWSWVVAANVLLGVSQGLTWSTTVIMKIDLVGPKRRGLAMGLNEFSGYLALAASAFATGLVAARYGLRPEPFYLGVGFAAAGLLLSLLAVRETAGHVAVESELAGPIAPAIVPTPREIFWRTSLLDRNLSSVSQAGLVNNLNDGVAWGLFRCSSLLREWTSSTSEPWPRSTRPPGASRSLHGRVVGSRREKWLIASGMWIQALESPW